MICLQCGSEFSTKRITARYCSNACKMSAKRARSNVTRHAQAPSQAGRFLKICAYCGAEYRANSPRSRYCSNAHKMRAYRDRKETR